MMLLNSFQVKLLANFCSDVAKGALLAALGFPVVSEIRWEIRVLTFMSGLLAAAFFLRTALVISAGLSNDY